MKSHIIKNKRNILKEQAESIAKTYKEEDIKYYINAIIFQKGVLYGKFYNLVQKQRALAMALKILKGD